MKRIMLLEIVLLLGLMFTHPERLLAADYDVLIARLEKAEKAGFQPGDGDIKMLDDEKNFGAVTDLINNKGVDWKLRIKAIHLLGGSGNPKAADSLIQMFYDPFINDVCPAIKTNLAQVMGNFKGYGRIVEALIFGLDDSEIQVREASILSLGRIASEKAVPFLIAKLKDRSFAIRFNAIKSIGQIGDRSAVPLLKVIAEGDSDPVIREEAFSSLSRILRNTVDR